MAPDKPASKLTADLRQKIGRLLGLLGSEHLGERDTAARMADALVRRAGATWFDVVLPPALPAPDTQPQPSGNFDVFLDWPSRWRAAVHLCQGAPPQWLTPFERQFVANLAKYKHKPSQAQLDVLGTICGNVIARGGAR